MWAAAGAAVVLALVVALVVLTRGEPEPPPPVVAEPVAPVEEEPPPPEPVRGEVTGVTVEDLSVTGSGLRPDDGAGDAPVALEQDAVDAAVAAAAAWLDGHLTAAQDGGAGALPDGLEGPRDEITTGLAHPDRAVVAARYDVTVGARGVPEWVSVDATLDRDDGSTATATFVFAPGGDDLVLLAALPGQNTDPPVVSADEEAPPTDLDPATDPEATS